MANLSNGMKQHQNYARSGSAPQDETFGAESPFRPVGGEHVGRKQIKEHQRGIPKPRGFHPAPDHGPDDMENA